MDACASGQIKLKGKRAEQIFFEIKTALAFLRVFKVAKPEIASVQFAAVMREIKRGQIRVRLNRDPPILYLKMRTYRAVLVRQAMIITKRDERTKFKDEG